jgi:hypothetical protein
MLEKDQKNVEFMDYPLLCEECRKMNKEIIVLGEIRKSIQDDMRNIIREELGIAKDHEERITSQEIWDGVIKVGRFRVSIFHIFVIGWFIYWAYSIIRGK